MGLIKRKSMFSYLFATSKEEDMSEVYESIMNNKIDCNDEFLERCQIVKDLFLNKINNGMTYESYLRYKESFKRLDVNTCKMYINNLIDICKLSEKDMLEIVFKELFNKQYACLTTSKRNSEIIIDSSLVLDILNEINRIINQFLGKYIANIIKDKTKEERIKIYNNIDQELGIYKIIIKELYIDKFSYLDNGAFKDIYNKYLNEIDDLFIQRFKKEIYCLKEDVVSYEKFPYTTARYGGVISYGYYRKI